MRRVAAAAGIALVAAAAVLAYVAADRADQQYEATALVALEKRVEVSDLDSARQAILDAAFDSSVPELDAVRIEIPPNRSHLVIVGVAATPDEAARMATASAEAVATLPSAQAAALARTAAEAEAQRSALEPEREQKQALVEEAIRAEAEQEARARSLSGSARTAASAELAERRATALAAAGERDAVIDAQNRLLREIYAADLRADVLIADSYAVPAALPSRPTGLSPRRAGAIAGVSVAAVVAFIAAMFAIEPARQW